jgi:hypothetical protein
MVKATFNRPLGMVSKFLLCLLCMAPAFSGPTTAAEIKFKKLSDTQAAITIDGEITASDVARFRQLALQSREAVVVLNSSGGSVLPALEIGRTLRIAGFSTAVSANGMCTSACALIWLAGSPRWLDGPVGFHAAYKDDKGNLRESGSGNALVGRYLTELGLPANAILFATSAPPDRILWLTNENKEIAGITFRTPPPPIQTQPSRPTRVAQSPLTIPPTSQVRILASTPLKVESDPSLTHYIFRYHGVTLRRFASSEGSPEDNLREIVDSQIAEDAGWLFYGSSGDPNKNLVFWSIKLDSLAREGSKVRVWVKEDHEHNKKTAHRTAISSFVVSCSTGYITQEDYTEYNKDGDVMFVENSAETIRIVPESMDDRLRETVC